MEILDILLPDPSSFFIKNVKNERMIPIQGYRSISIDFGGRLVVKGGNSFRENTITIKYAIAFSEHVNAYLSEILSDEMSTSKSYRTKACKIVIKNEQFEAFLSGVSQCSSYERFAVSNPKIFDLRVSLIIDRGNFPHCNDCELGKDVDRIISRFALMEIR